MATVVNYYNFVVAKRMHLTTWWMGRWELLAFKMERDIMDKLVVWKDYFSFLPPMYHML